LSSTAIFFCHLIADAGENEELIDGAVTGMFSSLT
jgi:hypothetical protein